MGNGGRTRYNEPMSMTIPSLNLLSPEASAAADASVALAHQLVNWRDRQGLAEWVAAAPAAALIRFHHQSVRGLIYGDTDLHRTLEPLSHHVAQTISPHKPLALLKSTDTDAMQQWLTQHRDDAMLLEATLRLALNDGRHAHLPALLAATTCADPGAVLTSAWVSQRPVPVAWAVHWFTQLDLAEQHQLAPKFLEITIDRQRYAALDALGTHALEHSLKVDWDVLFERLTSKQWADGAEWMIAHQAVNAGPLLNDLVKQGKQDAANWLLCRFPPEQRAHQLQARMPDHGFFENAQAHHEAQIRQQEGNGVTPTQTRRRLRA
jgi:hypothetical protein